MSFIMLLLMAGFRAFGFSDLEVIEIRDSNPSYEAFCEKFSKECDLSHSEEEIFFSDKILNKLEEVNKRVNENLVFGLDMDVYGLEENWALPLSGVGDCEDNALLKRKILVDEYHFPRGALRMTTAFHSEQFYAHALLAVKTSEGVFVLDQDNMKVLNYKEAPYIYEASELPGGKWMRFAQEW